MTKGLRQPLSSVFVDELMSSGWSRRDAEALELVQTALRHAHDPRTLSTWAGPAARALNRESVLAGAILRFGSDEYTARAARALSQAVPEEQRAGLARLVAAAQKSFD